MWMCYVCPKALTISIYADQELRSKEIKLSYDSYAKVLMMAKVPPDFILNIYSFIQKSNIFCKGLRSWFIALCYRSLYILPLFYGFGGFLLPPYLSNLCCPLVIHSCLPHFCAWWDCLYFPSKILSLIYFSRHFFVPLVPLV